MANQRRKRAAWGSVGILAAAVLPAAGLNPVRAGRVLAIGDRHSLLGSLLLGLTVGLAIGLLQTALVIWRSPPDVHPFYGVPAGEHRLCCRTTLEAVLMARAGQPADGYTHLLTALDRVETLGEEGAPRADELRRRYQRALDRYVSRHGTG